MATSEYGPVDLYLIGFEGDRPSAGVVDSLADLLGRDAVRLLGLTLVFRDADGGVEIVEIEEDEDGFGFGELDLPAPGIAGDEDIAAVADLIPLGGAAAFVAIEHVWARGLAGGLAAAGGTVLSIERIPADIVNEIADLEADDAEEGE